jgi:hypothetical protein
MIGSALSAERPKASSKRSNSEPSGCSCDRIVTGGLKVLNSGGIKMPTSTAFDFQIKGCIDAEMGGVSHVERTARTGIEHQRSTHDQLFIFANCCELRLAKPTTKRQADR